MLKWPSEVGNLARKIKIQEHGFWFESISPPITELSQGNILIYFFREEFMHAIFNNKNKKKGKGKKARKLSYQNYVKVELMLEAHISNLG